MVSRYADDKPDEREPRLITALRALIMVLVWILVGLAAFATWVATALPRP